MRGRYSNDSRSTGPTSGLFKLNDRTMTTSHSLPLAWCIVVTVRAGRRVRWWPLPSWPAETRRTGMLPFSRDAKCGRAACSCTE